MSAHLVLPVVAGSLTLVVPKMAAGSAQPAGPVTSLGGIRFTAGTTPCRGGAIRSDFYAFHYGGSRRRRATRRRSRSTTRPPDGVVLGLETPPNRNGLSPDPRMEPTGALSSTGAKRRSHLLGFVRPAGRMEVCDGARSCAGGMATAIVARYRSRLWSIPDAAGRSHMREIPLGRHTAVTLHWLPTLRWRST